MKSEKIKLGIGTGMGFDAPTDRQIELIAQAGFDAFFTGWKPDESLVSYARTGRACGIEYQSIHAPFTGVHTLWEPGEAGEREAAMLINCINACAEAQVHIMVAHVIIGFDRHEPNELGFERFERVLNAAERAGVRVAFENTEGEEYLAAVMDAFRTHPACGFCWDSGHELCYNGGRDMIELYGDRLIATHLNDNIGVTHPDEGITWLDDAHLLPLDGVVNWKHAVRRLERRGYEGVYTFELTRANKPGRHTHDGYAPWSLEEFLDYAHARAERLIAIKNEE